MGRYDAQQHPSADAVSGEEGDAPRQPFTDFKPAIVVQWQQWPIFEHKGQFFR